MDQKEAAVRDLEIVENATAPDRGIEPSRSPEQRSRVDGDEQ